MIEHQTLLISALQMERISGAALESFFFLASGVLRSIIMQIFLKTFTQRLYNLQAGWSRPPCVWFLLKGGIIRWSCKEVALLSRP
jgi:hypothetical protein